MDNTELKEIILEAQGIVKDVDAELKQKAFEIILNYLLDNQSERRQHKSNVKSPKTQTTKTQISLAPIPLDLKEGSDGKIALRTYFEQKAPSSNQETVVVFARYLAKYLKIDNVLPGHVMACYNEIGARKPQELIQLFRDIKSIKGWIEYGSEPGSIKLTISGENFVEHDLPRVKA